MKTPQIERDRDRREAEMTDPPKPRAATRLLPIATCYQCHQRTTDTCICLPTGRQHPPPWKGIPKWCPLDESAAAMLGKRNRGKTKTITPELAKAMRDRLTASRANRWLVLRDDDGKRVTAGDSVRFCYGIPPVAVVARIVTCDGRLVALCPGHTPDKCNLRTLRRAVGSWYKEAQ